MQDEIRSHFRSKLIEIRNNRGFSREDVANLLGCSPSKIGYIETGRSDIKGKFLDQYADTFGVSLDELLNNSSERQLTPLTLRGFQRNLKYTERIRFFEGPLISLPLQQDGYLRVLVYEMQVLPSLANSRLVAICQEKKAIQKQLKNIQTEVILSNQSLYQHIGEPTTMMAQISFLLDQIDTFEILDPSRKVRILPISNFCIFDSRATCTETPYGMLFTSCKEDMDLANRSWELLLKSRASQEKKKNLLMNALDYWQQVLVQE
jgi:transcriptional regulator with XRE-family HTH domain